MGLDCTACSATHHFSKGSVVKRTLAAARVNTHIFLSVRRASSVTIHRGLNCSLLVLTKNSLYSVSYSEFQHRRLGYEVYHGVYGGSAYLLSIAGKLASLS